MLLIRRDHMEEHMTMDEMILAMEEAFQIQESGAYEMPERMHHTFGDNVALIMPCFMEKEYSVKLLSTCPGNSEKNLPTTLATVLLHDAESGELKAILNGAAVTGMRTGALGGLSCKYLSKPSSRTLAVIGAGAQGFYQTLAITAIRDIEEVFVYDANPITAELYKSRILNKKPNLQVVICPNAEVAARAADIIVTCTTSSQPVLSNDPSLFEGKHIVAIGTYQPERRELPPVAMANAQQVFVDTLYATEESGDLVIPLEQGWLQPDKVTAFSQWMVEKPRLQQLQQEQTVFKSVGIALFDLIAARTILRKLEQLDVVSPLEF